MTQIEWMGLVIILLIFAVGFLAGWLYFVHKQVKRILKFKFLIRDDVSEDIRQGDGTGRKPDDELYIDGNSLLTRKKNGKQ